MKTEKEITKRIESAKADTLAALPELQKAIEENDWETAVEFANGIIVAACVINVAEGILED